MFVCLCEYMPSCECSDTGSQKRALDFLELELEHISGPNMDAGIGTLNLMTEWKFSTPEASLQALSPCSCVYISPMYFRNAATHLWKYNYLNGELFSVLQQLSAHLWVSIFSTGKLVFWRCIFFCLFILSLVCLFETVSVAQLPASIFEMLHSIGNRRLTEQWTPWCSFHEIPILAGVGHWCGTTVWGSPQLL